MIVSGLQIQRKKISQQKRDVKSKQKKLSRPYSSELPEINQVGKKSTKNIEIKYQNRKDETIQQHKVQRKTNDRQYSINKQSMTKKLVFKKHLSTSKEFMYEKQSQVNNMKSSLKQIREFNSTNNNSKSIFKQDDKRVGKKSQQNGIRCPSGHGQMGRNSSINFGLFDEIEREKITKYFRYYPMIIIQSCMKRELFMSSLNETGDIQVYNKLKSANFKKKKGQHPNTTTTDMSQPWTKLLKLANLKGKYKYRQKFNFNNSAQLKAIKWKRKQIKKKKQSQSSSSDEEEKKEKCRDMDTWKKAMGVEGAKVFIVKGKYTDFRNALLERGWVENQDKHSVFFDLKWTTKVSDLTFQALKPNQIVNHFNNNACLTSKYGICKSLRSIMYSQQVDIDRFFPKAFDLTDSSDFQNFLQMYKWSYCESILKQFAANNTKLKLQIIKLAYVVTGRRLCRIDTVIKNTLMEKYFVASVEEWLAMFNNNNNDDQQQQQQQHLNNDDTFELFYETFQAWDVRSDKEEGLRVKVNNMLEKLRQYQPQYDINGWKNIWIVKPAFLSRGRGIKCMNKFYDILNYSLGKETQYVVQKYIENPLIINKKKFDIRQWVLVEDYNPPKIWIYGEFYCRFCLEDYDQTKITNKFAHLTNNSVQKYNKNLTQAELKESLRNSMWTQDQLKSFIEENYSKGSFKIVQQKMREIVIATILSTADQVHGRKNSFQLIGYDFMIDDLLNPWLIEINTSPAMDYSTPVTQRLVKMVLEDVVKIVVDMRSKKTKKKTAGLFKCIHNGEDKFVSKHYNLLKKYTQEKENNQDEA